VLLTAPVADAGEQTRKKAIWGPVHVKGQSAFPTYRDLGVGIYQALLHWDGVAARRPADPTDPRDPAYSWPGYLDYSIEQARRYGIRMSISFLGTPGWANGGRRWNWSPKRVEDFRNFVTAAARRYPTVRHWMIWIEPTRQNNFMPLAKETRDRGLSRSRRRGPHKYARMLDAAYGALKRVTRRNLVIGGNSFVTGEVSPKNWIRYVKLPSGKPPRMDMWGHNPFGYRKPRLSDPPLGHGFADFGTLDTLVGWLDRYQRRGKRRLPLFLSEYTIPSDHANYEFNFWATREAQAEFATAALRITRRWRRIYTMGWFALEDEPPNGPNGTHGDENHRGLMTHDFSKKPSYFAFKNG
jgi:hypothetical protein